jgi:hypothetical protein
MKTIFLLPLFFLTACSSPPRLVLQPQPPVSTADESAVRYPEVVRAYHFGRYVDPDDDLVMHEQHVVYRVEQNTRWNFHAGPADGSVPAGAPAHDAAFSPTPVNDAVLAEVNAQRLATVQILLEARTLSAALAQFQSALQQTKTNFQETAGLRATVIEMKQRLEALEIAQKPSPPPSQFIETNEPPDSLCP